jgi:hypothetical protein
MIVIDEFFHHSAFEISAEELISLLKNIKNSKEKEIDVIKEKIRKYEKTRRAHEVWYQSLSPVRKFFAGRPPSHHQAVEYIVNVKERFNNIEQIKVKISVIEKIIQRVESNPELDQITLAAFVIEEIKEWNENGGLRV